MLPTTRSVLAALLAAALALAGCVGTSSDEADALNQTNATSDASDATGSNEAPNVSLEANRTSGEAPLAVSFTLDGNDPDGDELSWTFDTGSEDAATNGTILPTTLNHTYSSEGSYTAQLSVTDGNATAAQTVTITVRAPENETRDDNGTQQADGPGSENQTAGNQTRDPVVLEGSALVGHPAHPLQCVRLGVDGDVHEIAPAEGGWSFGVAPADAFVVYWWGEDGFIGGGEANGTVPADATEAEVCMTTGHAMEDYTLTLWPPEHPEAGAV